MKSKHDKEWVVYHRIQCGCGVNLTVPESVEVHFSAAEHEFDRRSNVDAEGKLVDVDCLVAHGYHAGSSCVACGNKLTEFDEPSPRPLVNGGDRAPAEEIWEQHGRTEAMAEGWDLFVRSGTEEMEIEFNANPEDWPEGWEDTPFHGDDEVIAKILTEKKRHQLLALYLEGRHFSLETWLPPELARPITPSLTPITLTGSEGSISHDP